MRYSSILAAALLMLCSLSVLAQPSSPTGVSGDLSICQGESTTLSVVGAVGTQYWYTSSCGGTFIGTGSSITVSPSAAEIYYVRNYSSGLFSANCAFGFVSVSTPPTVTVGSVTNPSCYGGNNGVASVSASGGSTPYTYNWSSGQSSATATGLTAGTYTATVTDNNSCSSSTQVSISNPAQINISFVETSPSCPGSTDGGLIASASGGSGSGYSYSWSTGATSAAISGISAGTYSVTVTDGSSCADSATYTVTNPPAVSGTLSTNGTSCAYLSDGQILVNPSGGSGSGYTYIWSTGGTSALITGLSAGTYTVTITDGNGCTGTMQGTVASSTTVTAPVISATNVNVCTGSSTTLTASQAGGGSTAYSQTTTSSCSYTSGGIVNISFSGTPTTASGNGTLTIYYQGDLGAAAEYITVYGESSTYIGATTNHSECSSTLSQSYTISQSNLTNWAGNGSISISFDATSSVQTAICGSSSYCVYATLTYPTISGTAYWFQGSLVQNTSSSVGTGASITASPTANTIYYVANLDGGCWSDADSVTVTMLSLPTVSASASQSTFCNGTTVALTATGAQNYSWSPTSGLSSSSGQSVNASPNTSTTYVVYGTNANGCSDTAQVSLTVLQGPSLSTSFLQPTCNGGNNGAASVSASGSAPLSYAWSTSSSGTSITGLTAGNYTVTVTDNNNCTNSTTVNVPQPTAVTGIVSTNATQCWNSADGQAVVNASGGAGGYTYLWSNGNTSFVTTNLTAGTYTVTLTDANNCTGTASGSVSSPSQVSTPSIYTSNTAVCAGNSTVTLQGNGTTTTTFTASSSTICSYSTGGVVNYTFNSTPSPVGNGQLTVTYTGDLDASSEYLSLYVDGGYFGQLNGGSQCSQTYTQTYTLTQAQLTTMTSNGSIDVYTDGSTSVGTLCSGGTSSCVSFSIQYPQYTNIGYWFSGTFVQNTSQSIGSGPSVTVNPTATTTYYYANYDGSCWSDADSVIVSVNPAPTVSATTSLSNICGGISTTLTGYGASTYQWSPTGSLSSSTGTTVTATPATTTTYTVTGTDANGCTNTATVTVNIVSTPAITLNPSNFSGYNINCNGNTTGFINTNVSGGMSPFSYSWAGPSGFSSINQNITNLAAGTYTLTVTGSNGCTDVETITLTQPNALSFTSNIPNFNGYNVACNGGNSGYVDITPTGGATPYSYSWTGTGSYSSTAQDATGLVSGSYSVTVTDANGCTATGSETLTQPTALVVSSQLSNYNGSNISCDGESDGSVTLTVSGGVSAYGFTWDGPGTFSSTSQNISAVAAGIYSVSVQDANNCLYTEAFNLSEPNALDITFSMTPVTCYAGQGTSGNDGTLAATISGGTSPFSYSWSNGASTSLVNALAMGSYQVTVTDVNGCTRNETNIVTFLHGLPQPDLGPDMTLCQGEALILSAGNYPAYVWSNGQTTASISPTTTNNYSVTVTDNNSCFGTDTVTVYFNALPSVSLGSALTSCGPTTVSVSSGYAAYQWNTGDTIPTLAVNSSGTYSVTVTDANGCEGSDDINVTINPLVTLSMQSTETACGQSNGSASVSVATGLAPYSYTWSNAGTTASITNISAGLYSVTVTDANACSASSFTTVDNVNAPTVTLSATNIMCHGDATGSITASVSGGTNPYSIMWSTGAVTPTISSLSGGTYVVTVSDGAGCTEIKTMTILEPTAITATSSSTATACGASNGNATVFAAGGTPPYTYEWNDAANQTTSYAGNLSAGLYAVTITDDNYCDLVKLVSVDDIGAPELNIIPTDVTCAGDSNGAAMVNATGGSGPYTYLWNDDNAQTTATATGLPEGEYGVLVTDSAGCASSETIIIGHLHENPVVSLGPDMLIPETTLPVTLDAGAGFPSYVWQDTSTQQTFLAPGAGTYWVSVVDINGCSGSDTIHILLWATGIPETTPDMDLTVFPNPTRGLLSIQFNSLLNEQVKIEVYTVNGQFVLAKTLLPLGAGNQVEQVDLSGEAKGLYVLKISHGTYSTIKRISVM